MKCEEPLNKFMATLRLLFVSHCAHLSHNLAPGAKSSAAINCCHSTEDREDVLIYAFCGPGMLILFFFSLLLLFYILLFFPMNEGKSRKATTI